jgi:thymidylate kinase
LADEEPERWIVVDGTLPVDEVTEQVNKGLSDRLPGLMDR